ncbi:MAG TPA: hypothetical protein VK386_03570 [Acidimicrobiales bacterium]|nr:hypothetical protein [Acidimicrobiales bacterium]
MADIRYVPASTDVGFSGLAVGPVIVAPLGSLATDSVPPLTSVLVGAPFEHE